MNWSDYTALDEMIEFEWNPERAGANLHKHGVGFAEAATVRAGTNLVLLAPDVAEAFLTAESVNETLRLVLQLTEVRSRKRKPVKRH